MTAPSSGLEPTPLVRSFPEPGVLIRAAYRDLNLAINDPETARATLGPISDLPKPWLPASCTDTSLRSEVWQWLEKAVAWLNHEYVWLPEDLIVGCWPAHPHLVHEIAVLVDQRYRADTAPESGPLEEWHRYALPAFRERTRQRLEQHCEDQHDPRRPAGPRFDRSLDRAEARQRAERFSGDLETTNSRTNPESVGRPRLVLLDRESGEI